MDPSSETMKTHQVLVKAPKGDNEGKFASTLNNTYGQTPSAINFKSLLL